MFCPFSEDYDAYIVVSFTNATLVLSIGETVEEVTDSGFLGTTPTLTCAQLGEDALIQVTNGLLSPLPRGGDVWNGACGCCVLVCGFPMDVSVCVLWQLRSLSQPVKGACVCVWLVGD